MRFGHRDYTEKYIIFSVGVALVGQITIYLILIVTVAIIYCRDANDVLLGSWLEFKGSSKGKSKALLSL